MIVNVTSKSSYSSEETIPAFIIDAELTDTVLSLRKKIGEKLDEKPLWCRYVIHANGGGSAKIYFTDTTTEALPYHMNEATLSDAGFSEENCNICLVGLTLYRSPWGDE
jgi:hypothetical protein